MHGNAFRVLLDGDHKSGNGIQGRFDLWAVKTPDFVPLDLPQEPKRAIMDFGASYASSSAWDGNWKNGRLDSSKGFHISRADGNKGVSQWWQVDMPGSDFYEVNSMILMKRGDGHAKDRIISAV
jgi:hypothetical protein